MGGKEEGNCSRLGEAYQSGEDKKAGTPAGRKEGEGRRKEKEDQEEEEEVEEKEEDPPSPLQKTCVNNLGTRRIKILAIIALEYR